MSTKREVILRYTVLESGVMVTLYIEQRDSGRFYLTVAVGEGSGYVAPEIELTPGLLQELRRALVKIA